MSSSASIAGDLAPLSERPASVVQAFAAEPLQTEGELLALGFAADGSLWSVEEPGLLRQWDLARAHQRAEMLLDDVSPLWCFGSGCRVVASASDEISLWDVPSGRILAAFTGLPWVTALAFSPDGRLLASGHDNGSLRIWDISAKKTIHELKGAHKGVSALSFSADGKTLTSAGEEKSIHLWDVATGEPRVTLAGHKDRISGLAWHPTEPQVHSAGWDTTVRVWDAESGQPIILLNAHATQVHALAISPDGNSLASADSAETIHLWDLRHNSVVKVWARLGTEIRFLAFSPDGRRLAAGGADHVIHIRDVHRDESSEGPSEGMGLRAGVSLTPDGKRLLGLSPGCSLRLWETTTGNRVGELQEAGVLRAFALSPDGKTVAGSLAIEESAERLQWAGPGIPSLFFWDVQSGKRRLLLDGERPPITAIAFSPDGKLLASANFMESNVWLWDTATGQPVLVIPGATEWGSIEALAFDPRGELLVVGGIDWMSTQGVSDAVPLEVQQPTPKNAEQKGVPERRWKVPVLDGAVAIWDLKQKAQIAVFGRGATALAVHPSGANLATTSLTKGIFIWSLPEGHRVTELQGGTEPLTCIAYSPDGRWLAAGGDDHTVRLWDAATLKPAAVTPLDTQVKSLCFSGDGSYLYTANARSGSYQLSVERMIADGV